MRAYVYTLQVCRGSDLSEEQYTGALQSLSVGTCWSRILKGKFVARWEPCACVSDSRWQCLSSLGSLSLSDGGLGIWLKVLVGFDKIGETCQGSLFSLRFIPILITYGCLPPFLKNTFSFSLFCFFSQ